MSEIDPRTRRFRITLILVFLVCAGPFILAWLWYAFQGAPELGTTTNAGDLVYPARPMEPVTLPVIAARGDEAERQLPVERRWTVLYIAAEGCGADCREVMWATRQIRLSLGRDMGRVHRVLLVPAEGADREWFRSEHEDLTVLDLHQGEAADLLEQLNLEDGAQPRDAGRLYIIDPLGNLMMYFPAGFDPDDFMDDMKRLLRVSQIG